MFARIISRLSAMALICGATTNAAADTYATILLHAEIADDDEEQDDLGDRWQPQF